MVGQDAIVGYGSYVTFGKATGTAYNTATANYDFLSAGFKTTVDRKTLEEVNRFRSAGHGISLSKNISGEFEAYIYPNLTAAGYLLQGAMGSTITTATVSAGASFSHVFAIDNFNQALPYLCSTVRKGDSSTGKVFAYNGLRVNEMSIVAEIDEPVKWSFSLVGMDSTVGSGDVAAALTITAHEPLVFTGCRLSVEGTVASLTSSSYWHVQSLELTHSNNLKADTASRRLGSNLLTVLPPGVATQELKAKIRFDTTTAYDAMIAGTKFSVEAMFEGNTLSGASTKQSLKFVLPVAYIKDAGDPEIGGPDELLSSEVTFQVLRDCSSATGYAMEATMVNGIAAYA